MEFPAETDPKPYNTSFIALFKKLRDGMQEYLLDTGQNSAHEYEQALEPVMKLENLNDEYPTISWLTNMYIYGTDDECYYTCSVLMYFPPSTIRKIAEEVESPFVKAGAEIEAMGNKGKGPGDVSVVPGRTFINDAVLELLAMEGDFGDRAEIKDIEGAMTSIQLSRGNFFLSISIGKVEEINASFGRSQGGSSSYTPPFDNVN